MNSYAHPTSPMRQTNQTNKLQTTKPGGERRGSCGYISIMKFVSFQLHVGSWERSDHERQTIGSSRCGAVERNMTSIHEDADLIPGLAQ